MVNYCGRELRNQATILVSYTKGYYGHNLRLLIALWRMVNIHVIPTKNTSWLP